MATSEPAVLQDRIERLEEALLGIERRLAALEGVDGIDGSRLTGPPSRQPATENRQPTIDFVLIGRSVLVVGGAYLLRALTELGVVPDRWGIVLGFVYALVWMVLADRAMQRGRRMVAYFDAGTAAVIAAGIIFESTARFHALPPVAASILAVIAAVVLRRFSVIAGLLTSVALSGVSVSTGDLLWPTLAAAVIGAVAVRGPIVAVASDLLAVVLIAMTALGRTPHPVWAVELVLLAFAGLWLIGRDPIQRSAALLIGIGGASAFALVSAALAIGWAVAAVAAAALGRRWPPFTWQAPFWAAAATAAAFIARGPVLPAVGMLTAVALVFAARLRLPLLAIATLTALASADMVVVAGDPAIVAMERSIVIAVAAVVLSLLPIPEGRTVALFVLVFGGVKLVVEDLRAGRATMMVIALAAYGVAMLVIAWRRRARATAPA